MTLEEYITKYDIDKKEFADACHITVGSINHYIAGRRRPTRKTARVISEKTKGIVTVHELRGVKIHE